MSVDRPVSRALLDLERNAPQSSPFLISPSSNAFAFPTPPPSLLAGSATSSSSSSSSTSSFRTFRPPPSALLAKVAAFLPQIAQANQKLTHDISVNGQQAFDIENVDESRPHIDMNLDVGVLEAQRQDAEEEREIIIPGGITPTLAPFTSAVAAAAAADEEDGDDDSDDSDDASSGAFASAAAPSAPSSPGAANPISRAARKKKKYRARRAAAATNPSASTLASSSQLTNSNPLIQEMEED